MTRFAAWAASATLLVAVAFQPARTQCPTCSKSKNSTASSSCTSPEQGKVTKCTCEGCKNADADASEESSDHDPACSSCCGNNKNTTKVAQSAQDGSCCQANCPLCQIASQISAMSTCPLHALMMARASIDLQSQIDELRAAISEMQEGMNEVAPMMMTRRFLFTAPGGNVAQVAWPGMDQSPCPLCLGPGACCADDRNIGRPNDSGVPNMPMPPARFALVSASGPMQPPAMQSMGGSPCCSMHAVEENGHCRIAIQCGVDCWASCDNLVLNYANGGKVKLTACTKQITLSGPNMHACADRVVRMTHDNCIVLEGHVHLAYHKAGEKAEVTAERVAIGLADGHMEIGSGSTPSSSDITTVGWQMPLAMPMGLSR
jgi:hypothetical protein